VDLGSNSFHMKVSRVVDGELQVIDRLREMVRLRAGLREDKRLTREAQARAPGCLERFGQRLRSMPPDSVRAAGTNTLRQARNTEAFLMAGEQAQRVHSTALRFLGDVGQSWNLSALTVHGYARLGSTTT